MSKHTPGPLVINQFGGQDKLAIGPSVSRRVCDTYGEANANLIAAAPNLLEALQSLLNALPSATTHPAIRAARAAIAKATGDQL